MMFKHLSKMLQSDKDLLTLTIARSGPYRLSVNLIPKFRGAASDTPKEGDPRLALTTPLCVVETPETLDAEFTAALERYSATHATIADSLAAAETTLKSASPKPASPAKKPAPPEPKPAVKPAAPKAPEAVATTSEPAAAASDPKPEPKPEPAPAADPYATKLF